uniref:SH3 domain-containing protein n=1 Tax=Mola mola TaxID=94237 RepID=A0A3Q3WVS5_MOLML
MSYPLVILLCVGLLQQNARAILMDKLADNKMCGDAECSYVLSMATALADFIALDCRFINIKKGQTVYVYSKLVPEEGSGVFWSGSVYSKRYVDQMGKIGYFPATIVKETHTFVQDTVKRPTTVSMFFTFISTIFDSNRLQLTFIEIYSILSVFQDMDFYCD